MSDSPVGTFHDRIFYIRNFANLKLIALVIEHVLKMVI